MEFRWAFEGLNLYIFVGRVRDVMLILTIPDTYARVKLHSIGHESDLESCC